MSLQSHPATPPGPRPGRPNLLIGDVEREWVCRALSDHFTSGRLTPAEFDDRVGQAVAARTDVNEPAPGRLRGDPGARRL